LAGLALVLGTWFNVLGLYSTIFLIWVFLSTQGFAFPNSSALSLAPFSKNAGTASALMGAIQLGIGAISTALVSFFNNDTAMPMAAVMCICAITSFIVLLIGRKIIAYAAINVSKKETIKEGAML
jgi:DHA1 family bicyclomycin/chloramphenicol resistance-like MFS transporter